MNKNNINNQSVSYYLNNIKKYKALTKQEIKEIFIKKKNKKDNEFDREKIIINNLRLVVNIAKRYRNATPYLNFPDLISAGNLGLFRAYDKFDVNKDKEFTTYATWWIRHYISREVSSHKHMVRKPFRLVESYDKFIKQRNRAEKKLGKKLSVKELSREINVPEKDILCFDEITRNDSEIPCDEILIDDTNMDININWIIKEINKIIKKESTRDKLIMRLKLGFTESGNYREPYSTTDVAKRTGMSIEGVRQVVIRLTNKIKRRIALG